MADKKATVTGDTSWQDRVIAEKTKLDENIVRLTDAIGGEIFPTISQYEQNLLVRQKEIMADLSRVLEQRIATFQHG